MLTNVSGHLTARAEPYVWDIAGSPYILTDHLYVDTGATLKISAGVQVSTNRYLSSGYWYSYDLNVSGTLNATGAAFGGIRTSTC